MKLSLSSFTPVNSQRVLRNFCMFVIFYLWKNQLTHINELDISFFMISLKVMKNLTGSRWSSEKINYFSSSKMAGTPMVYSSSRVKSISLKWFYLLNAWILFGLSIFTITSWSGKCRSNHLSLTYLLHRCIFDIIWQVMIFGVDRRCMFPYNDDNVVFA